MTDRLNKTDARVGHCEPTRSLEPQSGITDLVEMTIIEGCHTLVRMDDLDPVPERLCDAHIGECQVGRPSRIDPCRHIG